LVGRLCPFGVTQFAAQNFASRRHRQSVDEFDVARDFVPS
jgi:hypothetical protein